MRKSTTLILVIAFALACVALGQRAPQPQVPAASGPMLDAANKIAEAINKQDAASLTKMLASDCVYLDEDGHSPAPARWVTALTSGTPAKHIEISGSHGQMYSDTGWVSFNYVLGETFQGNPKNVRGTASLVLKKGASGDWMIQMIHGALYQKVAGLSDGE